MKDRGQMGNFARARLASGAALGCLARRGEGEVKGESRVGCLREEKTATDIHNAYIRVTFVCLCVPL